MNSSEEPKNFEESSAFDYSEGVDSSINDTIPMTKTYTKTSQNLLKEIEPLSFIPTLILPRMKFLKGRLKLLRLLFQI